MVQQITKTCWKNLETGPRTLTGFNVPITVSNYAVKPTPVEVANQLEAALEARKKKMEDQKAEQRRKPRTPQVIQRLKCVQVLLKLKT